MSEIDLGNEIVDDIKNQGSQAGLTLYDFDLSQLQITVGAPIYGQPQVQNLQPVEAARRNYRNCTRQTRTEHVQLTHTATSSYRIRLSSTLRITRGMSSQIRATAMVALGSNFSVQLDLTLDAEKTGSRQESIQIDASTPVAPCTTLKVAVLESIATFTVDFRIPVTVIGSVPCYLDVTMQKDPLVDWSYSRQFVIQGTAEVRGVHLDKSWEEYRANCPPGTPCARVAGIEPSDFWSLESWSELSDDSVVGATPKCGEPFSVRASATGPTRSAAAGRAQTRALQEARLACPSNCPNVAELEWTIQCCDNDLGDDMWLCRGTGRYKCEGEE